MPRLVWLAVYALASLYVMAVFMLGSNLLNDNGRTPEVQRRPLVFALGSALSGVMPEAIVPVLADVRDSAGMQAAMTGAGWTLPLDYNDEGVAHLSDGQLRLTFSLLLVVYAFLLGFMAALRRLALALWPELPACAQVAPLLALLPVMVCARSYAYTYDFAELFFATLYLLALLHGRWAALLLCVALGTLNKETTLFGIFLFAVWGGVRLPKGRWLLLLAAQLAVYAGVRAGINAVEGVELPLVYGNNLLLHVQDLMTQPYLEGMQVMCLLAAVLLLVYRWQEKPALLKAGLWMLLPNTAAFLLIGNPGEWRVFYWCLPVLALLATHSVVRMVRGQ